MTAKAETYRVDAPGRASWLVRLSVFVIVALWSLPTLGLLVNSFRTSSDSSSTGWWTSLLNPFTSEWTLDNYNRVLTSGGLFDALINSLIVTIPATVIPITLAAFAAFGFAWLRFKGRSILFGLVVALLVVPLQLSLVPLLRIYQSTEITGSFVGIWLAHTGFGLPLAVFLLYGFISQLPQSIFESAYIDGATPFTAFTRLVLPLSVPALASFAIFQFLWVWNDFLVALVFLGPASDVAVLTIELASIVGSRGEAYHLLTAGAFVSMIIPLVVFLSLQRYFVRGLLAGSVKG
ncbi:MAG: carbohydrate ABC transporter permease [Actinobacteria bacterium]|nr:carbohydrate ABC transporter permease [Actinomycetota bacterium]MCI0679697.1 carbohydrate ABC transporter permease [Actinomycetota bacterium]